MNQLCKVYTWCIARVTNLSLPVVSFFFSPLLPRAGDQYKSSVRSLSADALVCLEFVEVGSLAKYQTGVWNVN